MASTNKTTNYNLPQWIGSDKPTWLGDLNNAFLTIDTTMKNNSDTATLANGNADTALDNSQNALNKIGNLNNLLTTNKNDLVQAINALLEDFKNSNDYDIIDINNSDITFTDSNCTVTLEGSTGLQILVSKNGKSFKIANKVVLQLSNMQTNYALFNMRFNDSVFNQLDAASLGNETRNFSSAFITISPIQQPRIEFATLTYNPNETANRKWTAQVYINTLDNTNKTETIGGLNTPFYL